MKSIVNEYFEQCALAEYLRLRYPKLLWTATANGMRTTIGMAKKMKRAGLARGVPDVLIFHKTKYFVGLAIELKRSDGGVVPKEQKEWLEGLSGNGWKAVVAHGATEAIICVQEYLETDGR